MAATERGDRRRRSPVVDVARRRAGCSSLSRGGRLEPDRGRLAADDPRRRGVRGRRAPDGGLVATALALPYPPGFGWVSMVLVHARWRRRGLGTLLLGAPSTSCAERGLVACLDATPAGRALYGPLGFRAVEPITRWRGDGPRRPAATASRRCPTRPRSRALDRAAFGADRSAILADLLAREGRALPPRPGRQRLPAHAAGPHRDPARAGRRVRRERRARPRRRRARRDRAGRP